MALRYNVIPFVGELKRGVFSVENAQKVSQQLEDVINEQAQAGWEFVSVAKVDIEIQPGCLAALFGAKIAYISFDQVIFRHEV